LRRAEGDLAYGSTPSRNYRRTDDRGLLVSVEALSARCCAVITSKQMDFVQDCLGRALSRWRLWRAEGDLRGWLYTIPCNLFLTQRHRERRRGMHNPLTEVEADLAEVDGPESGVGAP
jgi:DNA-directed RNA polymerase specialized sigma24 family protein